MSTLTKRLEQNLGIILILALLVGCLIVLLPFVSSVLLSAVLCFSTWPLYQRLLRKLGGRRSLAAAIMTAVMVLVVLLPFLIVGLTMADNVRELAAATKQWLAAGPPPPPDWLRGLPLVGDEVAAHWNALAAGGAKSFAEMRRFIEPVSAWILKGGLLLGRGLLQLSLGVFIAFFFYRDGARAAQRLQTAVERIGGDRGRHLLKVGSDTILGVVYGILGTALVQAVVAGLGFVIAGVPGALLLAFMTFFLSVVPIGPPLVWIPASLWLFTQGSTGWGIFMLAWGIGISSVDNLVRPWLISRGSDLPFVLIFFGVLGGVAMFGFIGFFLGPMLLAVGYRLIDEWLTLPAAPATEPEPVAECQVDSP